MKRCLISFIRNEVRKEVKTTVSSLASGPFFDARLCPLARTPVHCQRQDVPHAASSPGLPLLPSSRKPQGRKGLPLH